VWNRERHLIKIHKQDFMEAVNFGWARNGRIGGWGRCAGAILLYGLSAWVSLDLTHKKEENEDFRVFLDFSFFTFFLRFLHEQDFLIFKLVLPTET
jgi:hypothetical protein